MREGIFYALEKTNERNKSRILADLKGGELPFFCPADDNENHYPVRRRL